MCRSLFFNKAAGLRPLELIKNKDFSTGSSCEFCEIPKNTFFYRTPPVAASVMKNSSSLFWFSLKQLARSGRKRWSLERKRLSRHRLLFIMILQSSTNKKDYLTDNYSNYNLIGKVSHTLNWISIKPVCFVLFFFSEISLTKLKLTFRDDSRYAAILISLTTKSQR